MGRTVEQTGLQENTVQESEKVMTNDDQCLGEYPW